MPRRSGDWWLVTDDWQLRIPSHQSLIPAFKLLAAASPPQKESQPRLAALGSPFQGKGLAWILPPSFLWKEVPRRGGGWMGKAVFPYHSLHQWGRQRGGGFAAKKEANPASLRSAAPSKGRGLRGRSLLPMEGGAPKGRRLDGKSGMKKSEGDRLKSRINESTLSTADAVPLPQWGRQRNENTAFLTLSEQIHAYVEKQYRRTTPSPRGEGGERSEPDRVLAV